MSAAAVNCTHRPKWNFDGSSTGQAPGEDSEVILYPQAVYADPFRGGDNIMVLCDCYKPDGTPITNNTRMDAADAMSKVAKEVSVETEIISCLPLQQKPS